MKSREVEKVMRFNFFDSDCRIVASGICGLECTRYNWVFASRLNNVCSFEFEIVETESGQENDP